MEFFSILAQNNDIIVNDKIDMFAKMIKSLIEDGGLLIGGYDTGYKIFMAFFDFVLTSIIIYYVLKVLRETRAWQLLKGFLFILLLTIITYLLNLSTINYILGKSITFFLIGFVFIFQPELRRALEKVGRNSTFLFSTVTKDNSIEKNAMLDILVQSCKKMSQTKTGALILIERLTSLSEVVAGSQSAVILDANLTVPTLEQIFYKNSPLHDGAVIIREGRIYAARCHILLSESQMLGRSLGTRHHAAVAASELGDNIAIVVSEETGTISIAKNGRLTQAKNIEDFQKLLYTAFDIRDKENNKKFNLKTLKALGMQITDATFKKPETEMERVATSRSVKRKIMLLTLSITLAASLQIYSLMEKDPVTRQDFATIMINKSYVVAQDLDPRQIVWSNDTAEVKIRARNSVLEQIKENKDILTVVLKPMGEGEDEIIESDNTIEGKIRRDVEVGIEGLPSMAYKIESVSPRYVTGVYGEQKVMEAPKFYPGIRSSQAGQIVVSENK